MEWKSGADLTYCAEKSKDSRPTCQLDNGAPLKDNITPHFSGLFQLFGICIFSVRT